MAVPGTRLLPSSVTAGAAVLTTVIVCGCASTAGPGTTHQAGARAATSTPVATAPASQPPGASPSPAATDPPTVRALLKVAQTFNNDYDDGHFGAVYDRWDARSQALITRSEYIRRHLLCAPATHAVAEVEGAVRGHGGTWLVSYRIQGATSVDTWYYVHHRWVFDIVRSNPAAARQYAMPFSQYASAVGCTVH